MKVTATFDTWAWLEYFAATKRGEPVRDFVDGSEEICTSALSLLEIKAKYLREGKPFNERIEFIARRSRIVGLDKEIALAAADHCANGLHTSDAIIYATAQSCRSTLLTGDEHFKSRPGVRML